MGITLDVSVDRVTSIDEGKVYRVDVDAREMTHTIEVGGEPGQPFAFDGAIWVPDEAQGTVTRIATGVWVAVTHRS